MICVQQGLILLVETATAKEGRKEGRQAERKSEGQRAHGTYLIARPFLTVPRVRAPVVSLGHDPVVQECVGGNIKHEKSNSD